ncbi:MAG: pyruvate kinase [Chloroflexi bacterium]|nr:pyruvate kinase [Chloroflexota bacterium]
MRRTKIVCTLGPATQTEDTLREMIRSGMDVARLNLSHGDWPTHASNIALVRRLAEEEGRVIAILQDLMGPRIRVGNVKGGEAVLPAGASITLTSRPIQGDSRQVSVVGADLSGDVRPGDRILVEEGLIELRVDRVSNQDVLCEVLNGGMLRAHKGINVPGVTLSIPTITDKDRADLVFGIQHGVDFLGLSFVRSPDDVLEARRAVESAGADIPLIAKIEKHEAVDGFDEILKVADGVMVARGDLGVEINLQEVPVVQKAIIKKCNAAGKPVITATQMLNSMIDNPRPTRAEVSDVANAIFDGSDAIMLSGETAVGRYPLRAVQTMAGIAVEAEKALPYGEIAERVARTSARTTTDAISAATVTIAYELGAKAIVTMTVSGHTARVVAKHRPGTPIIAATPKETTRRRLALTWGVQAPMLREYRTTDEMIERAVGAAVAAGVAGDGDKIIITAGIPMGISGRTNFLQVHTVGEPLGSS